MYIKRYNVLLEANCLLRHDIWTHHTKHVTPLGDVRPRWTLVWLVRDCNGIKPAPPSSPQLFVIAGLLSIYNILRHNFISRDCESWYCFHFSTCLSVCLYRSFSARANQKVVLTTLFYCGSFSGCKYFGRVCLFRWVSKFSSTAMQ